MTYRTTNRTRFAAIRRAESRAPYRAGAAAPQHTRISGARCDDDRLPPVRVRQ
jgi:hypothetical protein